MGFRKGGRVNGIDISERGTREVGPSSTVNTEYTLRGTASHSTRHVKKEDDDVEMGVRFGKRRHDDCDRPPPFS